MIGGARLEPVVSELAGGVPVVWQETPGPVIAALGFRVGRADEPLARSGLTHLVEHLAVAGLGERLYDYDGFVNGTMTWFGFRGTPDELVEYFDHIGRSLARLPVDRLDAELGVLRAEEARRATSVAGRCLLLRFGTRGWGTYDLPQYGLHAVTPDHVQAWAADRFGAANVVLWMTGAPPEAWSVDLPSGSSAHPEPPAVPLPGRWFPAWTTHAQRVTAVSMLLTRSVEAAAAAAILQGRLRHVLRDVDGSSYDVSLAVDDLDERTTHVLLTADGPSTSVVEAVRAVTDALASDGPTEAELAHQRAVYRRNRADPALVPGHLAAVASARLCGWATPSHGVQATQAGVGSDVVRLERADSASMAAQLERALATALYLVPVGTPVPAELASPLGEVASVPVGGRAFRPTGARRGDRRRLIVGPEGVSELDGERAATVRTAEATAVLTWSDGARVLVGADGTVLPVEPGRWVGATRALAAFDTAVPDSLVVAMGERPTWAKTRQ